MKCYFINSSQLFRIFYMNIIWFFNVILCSDYLYLKKTEHETFACPALALASKAAEDCFEA